MMGKGFKDGVKDTCKSPEPMPPGTRAALTSTSLSVAWFLHPNTLSKGSSTVDDRFDMAVLKASHQLLVDI